MKTVTLQIEGMMCPHCVAHVTQALTKIPGVDAQVSLENKEAVCTLTQDVSVQQLTDAVTEAGYSVTEVK